MSNEWGAEIFLLPDFIPDNGYFSAVVQAPENCRLPQLRILDIVNFQNYFWMALEKNSQIQDRLNLLLPAIRSFIFVLL